MQVINGFRRLTASNRVNVLIIDDIVICRNRSKDVELLAKVYDHNHHKFVKGYSLLVAGWSDGYNMVPIDFAMFSSSKKNNRYQEVNEDIDKRSHGYKRRREAIMHKPEVAL